MECFSDLSASFVSRNCQKPALEKQSTQTGRAVVHIGTLVLSGRKFNSLRKNVAGCSSEAGTI